MSVFGAAIVGLVFVVSFIVFDIFLAADGKPGNTWSEMVRAWSLRTLFPAWSLGVLMGHFFHPFENAKPIITQPGSIALLVWLTFVVSVFSLAFARNGHPIPPWTVLIPAFISGWLLWPV